MSDTVLAFDTSGPYCAIAILRDGDVVAQTHIDMARGQAEELMPLIQDALRQSGLNWGDISLIGVGIGPGNFTGVRIAVSAARGLAMGLNVQAVGVTILEAQRFGLERPVVSLAPAPRDRVYAQAFGIGAGSDPSLCDVTPGALPHVPAKAEACCIGHRAEEIGALMNWQPLEASYPLAEGIARTALARRGNNLERPAPLYMRPADAAPPSDPPPVILP